MTTQPGNDSLGSEEYARRLNVGDEILYLPEAAAFVHKSVGTLRYYRHLGIGPRSSRQRSQRRLLEDRPDPVAGRRGRPARRPFRR